MFANRRVYGLASFTKGILSRDANDCWFCIVVGCNGDKSFAIGGHGGHSTRGSLECEYFGIITAV